MDFMDYIIQYYQSLFNTAQVEYENLTLLRFLSINTSLLIAILFYEDVFRKIIFKIYNGYAMILIARNVSRRYFKYKGGDNYRYFLAYGIMLFFNIVELQDLGYFAMALYPIFLSYDSLKNLFEKTKFYKYKALAHDGKIYEEMDKCR
jgi:hypothetical protein